MITQTNLFNMCDERAAFLKASNEADGVKDALKALKNNIFSSLIIYSSVKIF